MRCSLSVVKPASAGSISTFRSAIRSFVLQLDDDLAVRLGSDVASGLDAAPADEDGHARDHLGLEVVLVRAVGVSLGDHGHPIAAQLDQQMVELVAVDRALL